MKFAAIKVSALKSFELNFGQLIAQDFHACVCCESFKTFMMESAQQNPQLLPTFSCDH
jgi:hypothetical protein